MLCQANLVGSLCLVRPIAASRLGSMPSSAPRSLAAGNVWGVDRGARDDFETPVDHQHGVVGGAFVEADHQIEVVRRRAMLRGVLFRLESGSVPCPPPTTSACPVSPRTLRDAVLSSSSFKERGNGESERFNGLAHCAACRMLGMQQCFGCAVVRYAGFG